jgi:hypothetical protein
MALTANERLAHESVAHAINLDRYSNGVVRRIIAVLNKVDADLFAQISQALESVSPDNFTVDRLETMLQSVRSLNKQAYEKVEQELSSELRDFADYETGFQQQLFEDVLPVEVTYTAVTAEQAYTAAMSRPFQGRLLKEWASSIEEDRMARIRDAIRIAYVEGQSNSEIVQRIRGTRAMGYADGIIEIDRRHAQAVVQTAISHMAGVTRDKSYEANADILKSVMWLSTLDNKTSTQCRIRDHLRYTTDDHKPIDHSIPWLAGPGRLHWNCRSTSVPVLKSYRELGLDLDETDIKTRASMDGQVPADMTYAEWIKQQSAARQDDILGETRGKLLRDGGLDLENFYSNKGKWLTLEQLRARDAAAFRKAGIE